MRYGYARVSSKGQNLALHLAPLAGLSYPTLQGNTQLFSTGFLHAVNTSRYFDITNANDSRLVEVLNSADTEQAIF
ncbi:hypothetical protein BED35_16750 [Yersinia enterocolitica]|uniref:Resolvase/invertase-type recombinase catalytic domain-containing protein n=1 Tax=Yersinia enterocolitica TaxID=630 RepID=A0ABM9SIP3_YEREN|nr:hypothetical protein BB936_16625 [Yersinia enterocolitica]AOF19933.1 hypothetical protein BED34_16285 [Yersinia enterocolitica]AOF24468.1 hypothetical protein BED33_18980 [Yersinia enterocolitica]AOF28108.1 hypothetical protein BED32_15890 [Yersinia enterocolitica]AOF32284.1 hypothetical protein BED35_16750 [Yersinia enterocolitica]